MLAAYDLASLKIYFFACFIALPQAVHCAFSKNCSSPHLLFPHCTIRELAQTSHLSLPANVCCPQWGQIVVSGLLQPEQRKLPRSIGFKHDGH
jgi:hypothetical protein